MLGEAIHIISTIFLFLCCCVGAIWAGFLLGAFLVRVFKKIEEGSGWAMKGFLTQPQCLIGRHTIYRLRPVFEFDFAVFTY